MTRDTGRRFPIWTFRPFVTFIPNGSAVELNWPVLFASTQPKEYVSADRLGRKPTGVTRRAG